MSDADKIKQLEGYIEGNTKRFSRREESASRHIASFKRRYADDPERVKELEDDYKQTLDVERKEMADANVGFKSQIDFIKKEALKERSIPRYDNACRHLSVAAVEENKRQGKSFCIRFAVKKPLRCGLSMNENINEFLLI